MNKYISQYGDNFNKILPVGLKGEALFKSIVEELVYKISLHPCEQVLYENDPISQQNGHDIVFKELQIQSKVRSYSVYLQQQKNNFDIFVPIEKITGKERKITKGWIYNSNIKHLVYGYLSKNEETLMPEMYMIHIVQELRDFVENRIQQGLQIYPKIRAYEGQKLTKYIIIKIDDFPSGTITIYNTKDHRLVHHSVSGGWKNGFNNITINQKNTQERNPQC